MRARIRQNVQSCRDVSASFHVRSRPDLLNHSKRSADRSAVDQEVEVNVNPRSRRSRVDNLPLPVLPHADIGSLILVLFGNQGRDVAFETARANAHDDEANSEDTDSSVWFDNDGRNRRQDENNVTDESHQVRVLDRVVASPVLISKPGTTEGSDVGPELIEHGQTGRRALTHVQSTGTRALEETSTSGRARRKRLLDEV